MIFAEIEEEKKKIHEKNIPFDKQCKEMINYIQKNEIKTLKRSKDTNVKIAKRK